MRQLAAKLGELHSASLALKQQLDAREADVAAARLFGQQQQELVGMHQRQLQVPCASAPASARGRALWAPSRAQGSGLWIAARAAACAGQDVANAQLRERASRKELKRELKESRELLASARQEQTLLEKTLRHEMKRTLDKQVPTARGAAWALCCAGWWVRGAGRRRTGAGASARPRRPRRSATGPTRPRERRTAPRLRRCR